MSSTISRPSAANLPAAQEARTGFGWFEIFNLMWAVALLAHLGKGGHFASTQPHMMLLTVASILLLLKPSSLARLLTALVIQLVGVAIDLPYVTNHWIFMTFAALAMLLCLASLAMTNGGRVDREGFVRAFRPGLAVALVLLYGFVTLCKLNPDFFDPQKSAGAEMYRWLTTKLPLLGGTSGMTVMAIWGTLLIEGGLPILLIFPVTRVAGLLIGWVFHLILGLNAFYDFSALMFFSYLAFLPITFPDQLHAALADHPGLRRAGDALQRLARQPATAVVLIVLALSPSLLNLLDVVPEATLKKGTHLAGRFVWLASAFVVLRLYLLTLGHASETAEASRPVTSSTRLGLARALAWTAPLLVLLNGLCPYVGLKTDSAFTMFSNLQTEGDLWNHAFLPRSMRIFPFQDDLVRAIDTSDPELRQQARQGTQWIEFEFRDYMRKHPETAVTYEYQGIRHTAPRAGDDPILSQPINPWLRKIFYFRSVVSAEQNTLRH